MIGIFLINYGLIWDLFFIGEVEGESEIKNDFRLVYMLNGDNLFLLYCFLI